MAKKAMKAVKAKPGAGNPWGLLELPVQNLRIVCWGIMPAEKEQKAMAKRILKNAWLSPDSTVEFVLPTQAIMNAAMTKRSMRGGVEGGTAVRSERAED